MYFFYLKPTTFRETCGWNMRGGDSAAAAASAGKENRAGAANIHMTMNHDGGTRSVPRAFSLPLLNSITTHNSLCALPLQRAVRAAMQAWSLPFFNAPMKAQKRDEDAMLKDARCCVPAFRALLLSFRAYKDTRYDPNHLCWSCFERRDPGSQVGDGTLTRALFMTLFTRVT